MGRRLLLALALASTAACASVLPATSGGASPSSPPRHPSGTVAPRDGPFPSPGALVPTTGCGRSAPLAPGPPAEQQVEVTPAFQQGQARRAYRLYIPRGYDPGSRLPLLLDLHGFGGSAAGEEQASGYDALADRMAFLAVYPEGLPLGPTQAAGWASTRPMDLGIDELGYFAALLNQLQRQLCVDERRIYVTGFSNGGGMTAMLACYLSGRVAAVAPVSGNYYVESKGTGCHPARPVPLLEIHGTADAIVPYDGIGRVESGGWPLLPIPQFLAGWAARDGCTRGPGTFLDSAEVTGLRWDGCRGGAMVQHYRWNRGGHGAPPAIGGIPAGEVVWRFLAGYSLGGAV
ncbi:PHB depolymerase family esterase [Candidatus Nephthysia bennettiae]|uniref:alpha/beta hydrolase family esterase n=1 Tax=Candidatus Nephthysia bennettiae TaxID=3127016 RepID=UPI0030C6C4C0